MMLANVSVERPPDGAPRNGGDFGAFALRVAREPQGDRAPQ
jgi:hypothetical protein